MKKLFFVLALILTVPAFAHGYNHHHGNYKPYYDWTTPFIVGGAIGYVLSQPRIQPPPPAVVYTHPLYAPPQGYRWETILDASCNCYRNVLVQN